MRQLGSKGRIVFVGSIKSYLDAQQLIYSPNQDADNFDDTNFGKFSAVRLKRQFNNENSTVSPSQNNAIEDKTVQTGTKRRIAQLQEVIWNIYL